MSPLLHSIKGLLTSVAPRRIDVPDARLAAVAAVFRQGSHGAELLFIRRAEIPGDPWSAQVGFPGGRREDGDEDLLHTAVRETLEEIGLDLRAMAELIAPLDDLQARARMRILPMVIRPFAFWLHDAQAPIGRSAEVADTFWLPVTALADSSRFRWYDDERSSVAFRFRAIEVGSEPPLWGLTHRMVGEILARLQLVDDVDAFTLPVPR